MVNKLCCMSDPMRNNLRGQKTGVLLAAYGSGGHPGVLALNGVTERTRKAFPGLAVRWAFTSSHMRNNMAGIGKKSDSVYKALCRMRFEGYTHVAVQSLHFIAGREYEALLEEVDLARKRGGPDNISVGLPLLSDLEAVRQTAQALLAHLPPERAADDLVLCVGHGARMKGSLSGYESLGAEISKLDPNILIATLTGGPELDGYLEHLRARGARTVWLVPLLAVIGKHAEKDLAGSEPASWQSRMDRAGLRCCPVLRGAAEQESFLLIWLDHLEAALERLY
jgi:sirohydrochlorin cobaltochelatase